MYEYRLIYSVCLKMSAVFRFFKTNTLDTFQLFAENLNDNNIYHQQKRIDFH
jgi:hypothetical protein